MSNNQQPGSSEQPGPSEQPGTNGAPPVPPYPAPGQYQPPGYTQTPYSGQDQQFHQPYGSPAQPGLPGTTRPKKGIPLWGWIGGGVVAVALLGVGGVVLANSLAGALKPQPLCGNGASGCLPPSPSASAEQGSPAPSDSPSDSAGSGEAESVYLFDESDFTAPPVWSIQKSGDWQTQDLKGGTVTYRNSTNNCLFTTHQAILPPTGESTDEGATALSMEQEIAGVKAQAGGHVQVADDSGSVYTKLRNDQGATIELQEAELRFKNRKNVDLVYRIALRSMPGSDGLMELTQACPASVDDEDLLWSENTRSVTMVDDPAATPKP